MTVDERDGLRLLLNEKTGDRERWDRKQLTQVLVALDWIERQIKIDAKRRRFRGKYRRSRS